MALIQLTAIDKSFRDGNNRMNHVLRGLNMAVEEGEFVAVKGRSGSGKTTLLSILGTLLAPDDGSYLLDGREMTTLGKGVEQVRSTMIGFLFQDHRLMPQFTVRDNILLPMLAFHDEADRASQSYAAELMDWMGISNLSGQYPDTLSGGEAGRVAACRALIMKPKLLLADEPTGQLDVENAQNMVKLFRDINQRLHTTIVMVTHSDETASAADRIVNLIEGKTV